MKDSLVFNDKKFLIVGGAGFVGSNLAKILLDTYKVKEVVIVDNLLSAERDNLPTDKRVRFIYGSIADESILSQIDDSFDYIFHLATYHGNQSSIHDPIADHDNNTITTLKLLNHVKNFSKLKKLVYSGAGCAVAKKIYGDAQSTSEDAPINIIQDSPYSISKLIGEFYCAYFHKQHNVPAVRARFQNVYGPGEILGAGKWRGTPATVWRNVTPVFIYKSINGEALPVENDGIASRDFIFVDDICRGLIACAINGLSGEVYNLASGAQTSIKEMATLINKLTGNIKGIKNMPKRNWDTSGNRYGSPLKAEKELSFKTVVDLEEGLSKTIEWTKNNLFLIEKSIGKHTENMNLYNKNKPS